MAVNKRTVLPDARKYRNLRQYKEMSEEEFQDAFNKKVLNASPSVDFEKRIERKLEDFRRDYDLNDLKINDMDTLRALVQAQISLEDYEQVLYRERTAVSLDNIVVLDKIQKIMSDLRSDISSFQTDLKITRKVRKSDQEASVISFIDSLKAKARKFYESRMSYIYCDKCNMLLGTIWTLYPYEPKNRIRLVCNRPTEGGGTCGNVVTVGTKELVENKGTTNEKIMPEGML